MHLPNQSNVLHACSKSRLPLRVWNNYATKFYSRLISSTSRFDLAKCSYVTSPNCSTDAQWAITDVNSDGLQLISLYCLFFGIGIAILRRRLGRTGLRGANRWISTSYLSGFWRHDLDRFTGSLLLRHYCLLLSSNPFSDWIPLPWRAAVVAGEFEQVEQWDSPSCRSVAQA